MCDWCGPDRHCYCECSTERVREDDDFCPDCYHYLRDDWEEDGF